MSEEISKKKAQPFRFLKAAEFEALSHEERAKYLKEAIEALKSGRPVDVPTDRNRNH